MRSEGRRLPVKECRYHPEEVAVFFFRLFLSLWQAISDLGKPFEYFICHSTDRSIRSLSLVPPFNAIPPPHHLPQVFATGCCILYWSTFPLSSSFSSKTSSSTSSTYKHPLEPLQPLAISIDVLYREYIHLTTRTQHSWRQIQIQLIGRWSSIYCDHQPIIEVLRKYLCNEENIDW